MNYILKTPYGNINFSWKKSIWLYLMLFPIIFIDYSLVSLSDVTLNIVLLFLTVGIGHSVGLHRGIIHKSYKTSKVFRNISLYLFVLTGLGSPLNWLKQHYYRDYWQNRLDCPKYFQYKHSLITDFYWNLHLTFIPKDINRYNIPKEDLNDSTILWLHKTWYLNYLFFMIVLYLIIGINSMLIATCLRTSVIILGHWYIGYASHKYGYSRHRIQGADESGYNDILLGLISFGEGFHNNHHSHPTSAKFSTKWYEIDFGWVIVWFLIKFKIIKNVKSQKGNLKPTAIPFEKTNWKLPKL
ncbi:fatty acid desaturase [Winogradskyella luteola]|uniref:Fatty acid desaturase n=1 Tax=Winogradskyella luteola TaxID=2828330 RepID=A0A9X1FA16_9FLAO|nr:fatty acid desaturase [Winogradskyella luteola]MBV7270287.1 fatty acid desaturase [Winogradskyella luteola]